MPVEKLTMATLSGPVEIIDTVLKSCIINRDFHLENAMDVMGSIKKLAPFNLKNPYMDMLKKACGLIEETGLTPRYEEFSDKMFTPEKARGYLEKLTGQIDSMYRLREEKRAFIDRVTHVAAQLRNLRGIDVQIDDILAMKYVKFRFGRIRTEDAEDLRALADSQEDVFYFSARHNSEWEYGLYVALPNTADQLDSVFASLGWERIRIAEDMNISGTPDAAAAELSREIDRAREEIEELSMALSAIKDIEGKELLAVYSYVRFLSDSFELRSFAGHRNGKFYIIGWVPADIAEDYSAECGKIPGLSCIFSNVKGVKRRKPPSKLTTGALSSVFRPFVEMYGSPAYGEADPAAFMSVTYTVIFGIMFGDVGQGIVLTVLGLLLWKKKKMWLGRILAVVGVSAAAFGFFYGSVFGNEHLLPFGFHVLEEGNTMRILIAAVILGMVLLLVCMVVNIINGIRQRDIKRTLFSPNGAAGVVAYAAAAYSVASMILGWGNILTAPYAVFLIVLPLLMIMASTPLTRLLTGQRPIFPHSVAMFIVEGFFELFESALSYISNTVSFLRIGAFAISHAGMMLVVYMLAGDGSSPGSVIGLIFGNAVVLGIEATLVCIQVMRLEFYEMLGRFYSGGGRAFSPKIINYEKIVLR